MIETLVIMGLSAIVMVLVVWIIRLRSTNRLLLTTNYQLVRMCQQLSEDVFSWPEHD